MTTAWQSLRVLFRDYYRSAANVYLAVFDAEKPSEVTSVLGKSFIWQPDHVVIENRFARATDLIGCLSDAEYRALFADILGKFPVTGSVTDQEFRIEARVQATADAAAVGSTLRGLHDVDLYILEALRRKVASLQTSALIEITQAHPNGDEGYVVTVGENHFHTFTPIREFSDWLRLLRSEENQWAIPHVEEISMRFARPVRKTEWPSGGE